MNKYKIQVGNNIWEVQASQLTTAITKAIKAQLREKKREGVRGYESYLCRGGSDPKSITIISCEKNIVVPKHNSPV